MRIVAAVTVVALVLVALLGAWRGSTRAGAVTGGAADVTAAPNRALSPVWECVAPPDHPGGRLITGEIGRVDMLSYSEGWVLDDHEVLHYDDGVWGWDTSTVTDTLYGLDMLSADEGWAVGENGEIAHFGLS